MQDICRACVVIAREVNRAGLADILGEAGTVNVQGEEVKKLDVFANDHVIEALSAGGHCCAVASEENEDIVDTGKNNGEFVVAIDPLDGSSNIDVNVSIGTIFSIYKRVSPPGPGKREDFFQGGNRQVAAGYVIYGSSVMLVYTSGKGVHGFTLDPTVGEFLLSHPNIQMPKRGKTYSINEGNAASWDSATTRYVRHLKEKDAATGRPYSMRYVGTLVADFHRTLINGGIFLYPASPKPKLRLLYEAAPLAFIVESFRWMLADTAVPSLMGATIGTSVSVILFTTGYLFFRAREPYFTDVL